MLTWLDLLKEKSITVFTPVHNEARVLAANVDLLLREVAPFFKSYEIFVVDDGSTDATPEILSRITSPHVKTLRISTNRGKGFALRESFKHATGDYIFFIDGGMELHPKEIRVFLGLLLIYEADIIIGSKRHPQSEVFYPRPRRFLSFCYQALIKALFHLNVTDTQVGLKLMRAEVVRAVAPHLRIDGYGFDLELLLQARRLGFTSVLEAPVRLDYFANHRRPFLTETWHILKVGAKVAADTARIYRELR